MPSPDNGMPLPADPAEVPEAVAWLDSQMPPSVLDQFSSSKITSLTPGIDLMPDSMNFSSIAVSSRFFSMPTKQSSPCRVTTPALTGNLILPRSMRRPASSLLTPALILRSVASLNVGLQYCQLKIIERRQTLICLIQLYNRHPDQFLLTELAEYDSNSYKYPIIAGYFT